MSERAQRVALRRALKTENAVKALPACAYRERSALATSNPLPVRVWRPSASCRARPDFASD